MQLKTRIGVNAEGIRGLFAMEDGRKGDSVATIPATTMMNVGSPSSNLMVRAARQTALVRTQRQCVSIAR